MDYRIGRVGRTIVVKLDDEDNVYECVEGIARKENIRAASVIAVGGIRRAKVVVGPENTSGKPKPVMREFDDAREIVGTGTIFWEDEGPKMHIHMSFGRKDTVLVGCPRGGAEVFCILELIIIELEGINAQRKLNPEYGFKLLTFLD